MGLLFIISGCSSNECTVTEKLLTENHLEASHCPIVDSSNLLIGKPTIKRVNIFFDASGSMAGYMPSTKPSSEFQKLIPDIISRLQEDFKDSVFFYPIYSSSAELQSADLVKAAHDVLYGTLCQQGGDTYLPVMLDTVYKSHLTKDAVNIFISDCIYSPRNSDKKLTDLATKEIRASIKDYTNNISTAVFLLHSSYASITSSPYYVIVFGRPANMHEVESLITKAVKENGQPIEQVNYGLKYDQAYYSLLPYTDKSSNTIANSCENFHGAFLNLQVQNWQAAGDSVTYWMGINLSKFPDSVKTIEYLKTNLNLNMEKGSVTLLDIITQAPPTLEVDDRNIAKKCTHFLKFKITEINDCVTSVNLGLRFLAPGWILTNNEKDDENNRVKTFGLERMLEGFSQAYNQTEKAYYFNNLRISIIKQ